MSLYLQLQGEEKAGKYQKIYLKYTHNHIVNSAEALSFRHVKESICKELINLFKERHSPSSALHAYEDKLYLSTEYQQKLLEILADRVHNPDYGYVYNLFQQYRNEVLGSYNSISMFKCLDIIIENYNKSGCEKAI
ncbi:10481_t:CDS:2 [Scutellospora calospora]|uniref:10481_t:CDS:1 n=1 Tax=Scutellospora calospora TaxID=85575 RepID=A0ACA9L3U0_9GLOM|nr:10481_t:CDS:2 [Scutellospora calospora]